MQFRILRITNCGVLTLTKRLGIHTHIHTYIHTRTHAYIHQHARIRLYVYVCYCMHACNHSRSSTLSPWLFFIISHSFSPSHFLTLSLNSLNSLNYLSLATLSISFTYALILIHSHPLSSTHSLSSTLTHSHPLFHSLSFIHSLSLIHSFTQVQQVMDVPAFGGFVDKSFANSNHSKYSRTVIYWGRWDK